MVVISAHLKNYVKVCISAYIAHNREILLQTSKSGYGQHTVAAMAIMFKLTLVHHGAIKSVSYVNVNTASSECR